MKRIFVALFVLIAMFFVFLMIRDFSVSGTLNFERNLITAFFGSFAAIVFAPLGIGLLAEIYGFHYLIFSLISVCMIIYGFIKHKFVYGQIMVVIGVSAWAALGMYGLGHGG